MSQSTPNLAADPEVAALVPERSKLAAFAKGLVIKTQEGYEKAADLLKTIKGNLRTIEDARTRITGPMNEALREINKQAKEASALFLEDEKIIKRAMIAYSDEQDRLRAEEQRKANEAAERERKRQLEIADRARAKGQESKAELHEERAAAVVAPISQHVAPKVDGVSIPKVWDFEITDPAAIPREYMDISETRIRKVVQALKGGTNIPGVRVFERKRIASGAA